MSFVVAGLLILSTVHTGDPDLWGHVRYGQDVLATGRLPATATRTYTAPTHPWINHENGSEIVFAALVDRFGPAGLTGLTIALGAAVLVTLVWYAKRAGASPLVLIVTILLAVCNMTPGWSVRPQIFTYAFFTLLLVVLDRAFAVPDGRRLLWVLPPLFAVWANMHGGFVAGLGVAFVFVAVAGVVGLVRGMLTAADLVRDVALVLAAAAATLLNPYGPRLLTWLVEDLRPPRPEISEWGRMAPPDPVFFVFVLLLGATVFGLIRTRRKWNWAHVAVLAVAASAAALHSRHVVFFGIAAGLFLPGYFADAAQRGRAGVPASASVMDARVRHVRAIAWTMAGTFVALLLFLCRTLWVSKTAYPVDALQFVADHDLKGKIVADFDWAQYTLAALPQSTVAFDGRLRTCYPQDIADAYFDFVLGNVARLRWRSPTSPPFDDRRILRMGEPDLVLLGRGQKHALKVMARSTSDWVVLYQDGVARLWGRRALYDDPRSARYVPPSERRVSRRRPDGFVRWPAFPTTRVP